MTFGRNGPLHLARRRTYPGGQTLEKTAGGYAPPASLRHMSTTNGGADLPFAATLFDACDRLRGSVESAEYKHLVLGLIFLKYISDSFERRRAQLAAELADPDSDIYTESEAERARQHRRAPGEHGEYARQNRHRLRRQAVHGRLQQQHHHRHQPGRRHSRHGPGAAGHPAHAHRRSRRRFRDGHRASQSRIVAIRCSHLVHRYGSRGSVPRLHGDGARHVVHRHRACA